MDYTYIRTETWNCTEILIPNKIVKSVINKYYKIGQNECHYVYNIVILLLSW